MDSNYVAFSLVSPSIENDLASCRYSDEFSLLELQIVEIGARGVQLASKGLLSSKIHATSLITYKTPCCCVNWNNPTHVKENLGRTGIAVARGRFITGTCIFRSPSPLLLLGDYAVYMKVGAIVGHGDYYRNEKNARWETCHYLSPMFSISSAGNVRHRIYRRSKQESLLSC